IFFIISKNHNLAALRQRVRYRHPDPVQAAGDVVHAVARARELAAGVQHGEGDLDRRQLLHRVHVDRDAAALVLDLDRAVLVDALAENDLVDAPRRHADIARQRVLAQAARLQELLEENDARVAVVSFHSYNAARYITEPVIAQVLIIP